MTKYLKENYPAIILVALLLAAFFTAWSMSSIFLPVLLALILAYVLNPAVTWLERKRVPRIMAIVFVMVLILVGLAGGIVLLGGSIQREVAAVQINLPDYATRLYGLIPEKIKIYLEIETPEKLYRQFDRLLSELRSVSFDIVRGAYGLMKKAFTSTLGFILTVTGYFITPVYLFYFLSDLPRFKNWFMTLVPARFREGLKGLGSEIDTVLAAFVRGQISVCAILAVLYSIGLSIIGIDLAVVTGTISGILFIIPYVGTIFGILVSMVLAFLKFHDLLHPLLCLGWFMIVQGVEGTVITPTIVGNRVGLHPVIAIIALFMGGQWFGIFGMLLAVPVAAVLKVLLGRLTMEYMETPFYRGS